MTSSHPKPLHLAAFRAARPSHDSRQLAPPPKHLSAPAPAARPPVLPGAIVTYILNLTTDTPHSSCHPDSRPRPLD